MKFAILNEIKIIFKNRNTYDRGCQTNSCKTYTFVAGCLVPFTCSRLLLYVKKQSKMMIKLFSADNIIKTFYIYRGHSILGDFN